MITFNYIIYDKLDRVAWITLNRPEARNALNEPTRQELIAALSDARDDEKIHVVAITGAGDKAFCAGADISEFPNLNSPDQIKRHAHLHPITFLRQIPKPVVAMVNGLALGGGCEICLAMDKIVAHAELYMGLVEIGVGLLPAGGGCLNLWKKFISTVPEAVKDYDLSKYFVPVFMSIGLAKVSSSAADARANGFLGPNDRIIFNRDYLIGEAKKEVLRMVEAGFAPPVKKKIPVMGQAAQGMIKAEIYNMLQGQFISEYDAFLAERIAYVISGGDTRDNSEVDEEVILKLEREAFVGLWKQEKTLARVEHFLKTGRPLRN